MSAASRGEDTERKNCQTNTQVTSFIPPPSPVLPLPALTGKDSVAHCFPVDYTRLGSDC